MPIQLRTRETVCLSVRLRRWMYRLLLPPFPFSLRQRPSLPPSLLLLIAPLDLGSLSSSSRGWSFTCVSLDSHVHYNRIHNCVQTLQMIDDSHVLSPPIRILLAPSSAVKRSLRPLSPLIDPTSKDVRHFEVSFDDRM